MILRSQLTIFLSGHSIALLISPSVAEIGCLNSEHSDLDVVVGEDVWLLQTSLSSSSVDFDSMSKGALSAVPIHRLVANSPVEDDDDNESEEAPAEPEILCGKLVIFLMVASSLATAYFLLFSKPSPVRLGVYIPVISLLSAFILFCGQHSSYIKPIAKFEVEGVENKGDLESDIYTYIGMVNAAAGSGAWALSFTMSSLVLVWPYIKLLGVFCVTVLANTSKITMATAYRVVSLLNLFSKWAFAEVSLITFLVLVISTHGVFDITIIGRVFGSMKFNIGIKLLCGAVPLVYAIAMSCVLTAWAQMELEEKCSDEELTSDPLQASFRGGAPVKSSEGTMTLIPWELCYGAIFFLVAGSVIPLCYVKRNGMQGEILKENAEMRLSYMSMVYQLVTDSELRMQPAVVMVAVAFLLLNLMMPFATMICLARSASAAGEEAVKSRRLYRVAKLCSLFDCTEVSLVMILLLFSNFGPFTQHLTRDECEQLKPLMEDDQKMAAMGMATGITACVDPIFRLGPGALCLMNVVIIRTLALSIVRSRLGA